MKKKIKLGSISKTKDTDDDFINQRVKKVSGIGMSGTLPFSPGKVVTNADKIPQTVKLEALDQAEEIETIPAEELELLKQHSVKPMKPVNIDELPEEKQKEIFESVKNNFSNPTPVKPSINNLKVNNVKNLKNKVNSGSLQKMFDPKLKVKPKVEQEKDISSAEQITKPAESTDLGANIDKLNFCKRCGWDNNVKDTVNITSKDKQVFTAAILGQQRFVKDYDVFDGQMKVTFKALTVKENQLVIDQLMHDWKNNKLTNTGIAVAEANNYQLVLGLKSISYNNTVQEIPELFSDDVEFETPTEGTILPDFLKYVYDNYLKTETMRRIVLKMYGDFINLQNKLEVMAENSDFWKATVE